MPKPKPSPKRTNWKQAYERISAKIQHAEENRDYYLKRWTIAEEKLKKAERHNAELLKEREAMPLEVALHCDRCNRPMLGKTVSYRCVNCANPPEKPQSWLQRVWRAWR